MRGFNAAIEDCNEIHDKIDAMKDEDREEDAPFYNKIYARAHVKRAAAYTWTSEFEKAVTDFNAVIETAKYAAVFNEQEIEAFKADVERIQMRSASLKHKQEGDFQFYKSDLPGAEGKYLEALELDKENEYALANMGVVHLKRLEYDECIEYSSRALNQIDNFYNDTKNFLSNNILEVKILMRRAKSYEMTNQYENAKADLDKCLILEPKNGEANNLLKHVDAKLNTMMFGKYKAEADDHLRNKKFVEALESYEKCLRATKKATTLDNIAIYVNKLACLLFLDKLDLVVIEANDAIRLIKNFRNRAETSAVSKEDRERLRQMDLRVSVRRGNALAKLQRTTDAITELERALKIDPGNA